MSPVLDESNNENQPSTYISPHVFDAVRRGWKVFPIALGTKDVCLTTWTHGGEGQRASSDPEQLEKWFPRWGRTNFGLATGEKSDVFVLDTDNPKAYEYALSKGWTNTRVVKSGSSTKQCAYHFYFKQPKGFKVKTSGGELFPDLDVRGDGGMVLLPGSLHPDGNFYELLIDMEPADAPADLLEAVEKEEEKPPIDLSGLDPLTAAQKQLALEALSRACGRYANIGDGPWNIGLTKLTFFVGTLIARDVLTWEQAEARIMAIPTAATYYAQKPRTVKNNINRGLLRGMNRPWDPTDAEEYQHEKLSKAFPPNPKLPEGASLTPLVDVVTTVKVVGATPSAPPPPVERGLPRLAGKSHVEPFPTHLLGPVLQRAAEAISYRVDCVPDIAAQAVLSGAALAVCPHYNVRLVFGQIKPTSLFLMSVGRSGDRKTAADTEAMVSVGRWEKELRLRHKREKPRYDAAMDRWEKDQKKLLDPPPEGLPPFPGYAEPKPPTNPVVRCDNPTAEGMRDSFIKGSKVLGLYGDEGGKFLGGHSMKEEHRMNCVGSLNSMWDGTQITKMLAGNTVAATNGYRLAAHLMMQPGIAESFLGNEMYQDIGILARFLVSWADLESLDGNRPFKEPDPNYDNIMAPYNERIYQLLSTPLPEDEWGELTPLPVHFSAGAKALWIKYQNESQAWMKPRGKWKPIRAFGEKALEHAARLGVVLQQFNSCSLELSAEYFAAGWELVLYYAGQLLATQGITNDPELLKAHQLYQWLEDKHVGDFVNSRTMLREGPSSLRSKKSLDPIVNMLFEHGLLEEVLPDDRQWRVHRGF
jgi:hypothetical protein